jgi:hypothetical protein
MHTTSKKLPANEAELKALIECAVADMFANQPDIFDFTPETGQTEWNLAHHLALELREAFPPLSHDFDVLKRNYDNRRPDIIFHKRRTHRFNYLVIEVKRDATQREVSEDAEKIKTYWFKAPLRYVFGATVDLRSNGKHNVQVFKNEIRGNCAEARKDADRKIGGPRYPIRTISAGET